MKLALLAAFLALPVLPQEVTITYDQATPTIEKTLAKVYPKDMHGYFVQACNWTTLPARFNPEWMLAKASGTLQVQSPLLVLVAAKDSRSGTKKAIIYRGVMVVGAVTTGFAAGGLIAIPTVTKFIAGGVPLLAPFVRDGASKATQVDKPADWVDYDKGLANQTLEPGDCVAGTMAAASGGPKSFSVTVKLKDPGLTLPEGVGSGSITLTPFFSPNSGTTTILPGITWSYTITLPMVAPAMPEPVRTWSGVTHPMVLTLDERLERFAVEPASENLHELAEAIRGMSH